MKSGAMALATMGLNPTFLRKTVFAQDLLKGAARSANGKGKVLVVLFQRGAADALNVVVPHGEQAYYKMRPAIAVPRPSAAVARADGDRPRRVFRAASIARFVQAAMERRNSGADSRRGEPEQHAVALRRAGLHGERHARQQGHARRLAQSLPRGEGTCDECKLNEHGSEDSPFQAVSMTPQTPRILEGSAPNVAMNSLDEFTIRTNGTQADRIEALYRTGNADVIHAAGGEMFEAMKISRRRTRSSTSRRTTPTIRGRRSASTCARLRS